MTKRITNTLMLKPFHDHKESILFNSDKGVPPRNTWEALCLEKIA